MSEFEELCDKHGLSPTCYWCPSSNPCMMCDDTGKLYPTLSELLDKVRWKAWMLAKNGPPNTGYSFVAPGVKVHGETKELAVLKALIEGDEDE